MARTRLRQLEQIRNSLSYDDNLNMGSAAELQPGEIIGQAGVAVKAANGGSKTISINGNFVVLGANKDDQLVVELANDTTASYKIVSLSYDAENDETDIVVEETLAGSFSDAYATVRIDNNKNLRRDLDFIRTQLRILNQKTNWYDTPLAAASPQYYLYTGQTVNADGYVALDSNFDAGQPYSLEVYLNGTLLLPSLVSTSSNTITTQNDYTEWSNSQPVGTGQLGTRIQIHFPLTINDILQFRWSKK